VIRRQIAGGKVMGLRLSFGIGPLRASVPLTGSRRRRSRAKTYHGTPQLAGGGKWKCHHEHRTPEAAQACADREAKRRQPPPASAPARRAPQVHPQPQSAREAKVSLYAQPAEYIYCTVTNVQVSADRSQVTLSLVSDSGEQLPDVPVSVAEAGQDALEIAPGDRFTYDGETLGNQIPASLAAQYQELQAKSARQLDNLRRLVVGRVSQR
jgi:hypothetical protein